MARKPSTRQATAKPADPFRDPPTVARVRAVRAKMLRDAGGTLAGLTALAQREAAAMRTRTTRTPKRRAA